MGMPVTTPMAKLMAKIFDPEAGGLIVMFVASPEADGLQDHDQQGQPHGELGKEIVEGDRESEVQSVDCQG